MTRMSVSEFRTITKKGNKYGNKKTIYKGEKYDSEREADYARDLDTWRSARSPSQRVVSVQRQYRYLCVVRNKKICTYVADFVVEYADKHTEVVDVKGFKTEVYKIKKKLVEALYKIEIKEV